MVVFISLLFFFSVLSKTLSLYNDSYRLPTDILPINYNLQIHPIFVAQNDGTFVYFGTEEITLNITDTYFTTHENTNDLFVLLLNIGPNETFSEHMTNIALTNTQNESIHELLHMQYSQETQITELTFNLTINELKIALNDSSITFNTQWNGTLRQDSKGFYLSSYNLSDHEILNAVTQFEATDARRAFPCFDEPSFKATFNISYIAPINATTVGNMPIMEYNELCSVFIANIVIGCVF